MLGFLVSKLVFSIYPGVFYLDFMYVATRKVQFWIRLRYDA